MRTINLKSFVIAIGIVISSLNINAQGAKKEVNHHVGEVGKGPHGGTIQEADPNHAEILIKDGIVMLYLLDGDAKMINNAGVTAKATFLMLDGKSMNVTLTASGDDGFMVKDKSFAKYKSCIASFTMKGKTVSAKFKNYTASMNASYSCPMHADVKSDKPGKCPKCGMDLELVKQK